MPIATYSEFSDLLNQQNSMSITSNGRLDSYWTLADCWVSIITQAAGAVGAAPSTPATLSKSNTTAANYYVPNQSPNSVRLIGARLTVPSIHSTIVVIDRLSHQAGLSGTVTTPQTTNLPTAALTRYTDGVGVMAGLSIYSWIGSTATTFTVSYTNQAGTSGRTSTAHAIGGSSKQADSSFVPIPLQQGDTGVRSVESVTLAGTTGGAGNFGVVLFKPLAVIAVDAAQQFTSDIITGGLLGGLQGIDDNAHISFLANNSSITSGLTGSLLWGGA